MILKWKYFKQTNSHICTECGSYLWEYRRICERCGLQKTMRPITKKDYKKYKANKK